MKSTRAWNTATGTGRSWWCGASSCAPWEVSKCELWRIRQNYLILRRNSSSMQLLNIREKLELMGQRFKFDQVHEIRKKLSGTSTKHHIQFRFWSWCARRVNGKMSSNCTRADVQIVTRQMVRLNHRLRETGGCNPSSQHCLASVRAKCQLS